MKKLHTYVLRYWYGYLFAIVCMILAIALDMLYPMITESIIDDVIIGGQWKLLTKLLIGIAVVGAGRAVFGYYKEFTFDKLASSVGSDVRKDLFNHIQSLSMNYFADTNTGELMARVKDDVDKVKDAFGMTGMLIVQIAFYMVSVIYCMFMLDPLLTLLPFAVNLKR